MPETFEHGYALLIGVGDSAYSKLSLPVTVKDTRAIYAALIDSELCGYIDNIEHIRVLNNKDATKQAILDGLTWLQEMAENDPEATVFVYYSGHGWVDKTDQSYYLLQHDIKPSKLATSALSAEDFTPGLRQIKAERLLVVIDSCHAAGMATSKDAEEVVKADRELFNEFDDFQRVAFSKGLISALKQGKGWDEVKSEATQKINKIADVINQYGKFITNINEAHGIHIGDVINKNTNNPQS